MTLADNEETNVRLTRKQREALELIAKFDRQQASIATNEETWADDHGAFIHWRTAQALADRGLIYIDNNYPDGWVLGMEDAGRDLLRA